MVPTAFSHLLNSVGEQMEAAGHPGSENLALFCVPQRHVFTSGRQRGVGILDWRLCPTEIARDRAKNDTHRAKTPCCSHSIWFLRLSEGARGGHCDLKIVLKVKLHILFLRLPLTRGQSIK